MPVSINHHPMQKQQNRCENDTPSICSLSLFFFRSSFFDRTAKKDTQHRRRLSFNTGSSKDSRNSKNSLIDQDSLGGGAQLLDRLKKDWNDVVKSPGSRGGGSNQALLVGTPESKRRPSATTTGSPSLSRKRVVAAGDSYKKGCDLLKEHDVKAFRDWLALQCADDPTLLDQADEHGWTLLHFACGIGKLEQAYTLLEAGASAEAITGDGSSMLHLLAKLPENERQPAGMYYQLLQVIGNRGAKGLHAKQSGDTPLHVAAMRGNQVAVSVFIEWGYPLNGQTLDGKFTALHYAVMGNRVQIVKDLVKAGSDPNIPSSRGTAMQIAEQLQLLDVCSFFHSIAAEKARVDGNGDGVVLVTTERGSHTPHNITGCWDEYRDVLFPKTHYIFYLDVIGFICILPSRCNDITGNYEGLLLKNTGFQPLIVEGASLDLYRQQNLSLVEQMQRYLDSRGLLQNHGRQLAALNAVAHGQRELKWVQMLKPDIPMRLLELETRLTPRKRISVGVILGKADQTTEEEMFTNPSDKSFEKFLTILGEKIQIGKFPGWTGTLRGGDDNGIFCIYTCWMGFEFIFHVAPFLDAQKQRQHIGNDMCLIIWKEGPLPPKLEFRGQVNSVAIVVTPSKRGGSRKGDDEGDRLSPGRATSSSSLSQARSPHSGRSKKKSHLDLLSAAAAVPSSSSLTEETSSEERPSNSKTSTLKRKSVPKMVTLSCYHRKSLTTFTPNLPERELEVAAFRNTLRSYILSTLVNGTMATLKSGPFAPNTIKLFTGSIGKIIDEEKAA